MKGTYDVLIFLGVVGYLRYRYGSADVLGIFGSTYTVSATAHPFSGVVRSTFVLYLQLHIEKCDNFALPLAHVHISIHAQDL